MSSEQQTTSKSFTYVYLPFLWMTILHPYTWYLTELSGWLFFDGPGSELLWSIFIRLRGDLLRGCLVPFWFFIVNCTSFSEHSTESSSSKEDSCTWEHVFSCICFSLLISVFIAITGLGIQSFTGGSPEKLKYIDPNVEMTL